MASRIFKAIVVLGLAASLFFVVSGWGGEAEGAVPQGVVTSEPLPCMVAGDSVVCIDGLPSALMACEKLDASTVLCTSE